MEPKSDHLAVTAFAAYSILAGGNAVSVRYSNLELDPFWGAALRFTLAALLMLGVMFATGHKLPTGRALAGAAVYGLLAFGGAFAFAFYALVELEAGFGQILLSIVPLATLLLAVAQRLEVLKPSSIVGALLATTGVIVMSGLTLEGPLPLASLFAGLGAALCFAQASPTIKRFPPVHPLVENAVGMTVGAAFLTLLTLVSGSEIALPRLSATWWALAYMVVVGSGAVFTLYVIVLRLWDASRANYGFVIIPMVTVLVAAWLLDEQLTFGLLAGGTLVVIGVYIGALQHGHRHRPHPAART